MISVKGFGAIGNGIADDTAAIQSGLNAVASAHDVLDFPVGVYKITDTLTLVQKSNFGVRGPTKQAGTYNTRILWVGPQGGKMLLLDGVRDTEWSDIALDGNNASVEPAVIVDIDKITAGPNISRKNGFRRMLLRGGTLATVRIANTSTTNNEGHIFEDVDNNSISYIQDVSTQAGYQVKNINAKNTQIIRGSIAGKGTAVDIVAGSIHLHSVEVGACATWVRIGGGGEPITIENCDGDQCKTFIELLPAQTSPIVATNNRCIQSRDGNMFIWNNNRGPVTFIENDFASGGYRPGATVLFVGNGPRMTAIGNVFPNANCLPLPAPSVTTFQGLFAIGNVFYSPGNQLRSMDDVLAMRKSTGWPVQGETLWLAGQIGSLMDTQNITVTNQQIYPRSAIIALTAISPKVLVSTPTINSAIFNGMTMKLLNLSAFNITLQDQGTLANSGLALTSPTVVLAQRQSIELTWSATLNLWVQTGSLVTPL